MASVLPLRTTNPASNPATFVSNPEKRRPSLASALSSKHSNSSTTSTTDEVPPVPPKTTNGSASQSFDSNSASAVPSHQSSVIRKNRRKVRPQYPSDSDEKHVEYILVASFDIDRGSVMEHQYPAAIGGDEHMLAELMLPDQAHVRSQDWTMFFLHKDTSGEQQQDKSTKRRRKRSGQEVDGHDENDTKTTESEEEEGYSEEEEGDEGDEHEDLASTEGPPLVYVLNLVNTKQDNTAKRGAVVKAMAVCTRHPFLHIYKPLLLLALEQYFRTPVPETLATLYEAVNSMDLSLVPRLSTLERLILQASDVKDLYIEKFESMVHQRMMKPADEPPQPESVVSPILTRQRYGLPRDTHEFECTVPYNKIPIPVKIPTAISAETVGDFSIIQLIQTFSNPHSTSPQPFTTVHPHLTTSGPLTHPIIVLLNALLTQKRVIFIGHNLPSSNVAESVLAACALTSGGLLRGFVRHAFPYTDLTKVDDLLMVPGFIAGVNNPTFALHAEWWDVLCDLPTGRMKISPKIEQAPRSEGVLFFQQPANYAAAFSGAEKGIGAIAAAGASLSAGLGGSNAPMSNHYGDPTGDSAFMASVLSAINERRGEAAIRAKFRLWILKFTRLAAAFEEMVYGASALRVITGPASSPTAADSPYSNGPSKEGGASDPTVNGYGYVWQSPNEKIRELAANATRIEGWMKTRSYYNFIQDLTIAYSYRPIKDLDLQHLHDKLTKLRLGAEVSGAIYMALCNAVHTYEEINQLLVVVVNTNSSSTAGGAHGWSQGGGVGGGGSLFYIALGLFHPRTEVREAVADLLSRIRDHEAGRHFWARLGGYERAAWQRVMLGKREREEAL